MIARLALFGATGDLAGRYLLPALAALKAVGQLTDDFELTGAAREDWDDEMFRKDAADRLAEHAADTPRAARDALVQALRYRPVDVTDAASVAAVIDTGGEPIVAYLALPPALFGPTATALAGAGLPAGSRVAFEKPFGDDLRVRGSSTRCSGACSTTRASGRSSASTTRSGCRPSTT
jgi:glucose-6-phosphate 1-dehydrogenase